MISGAREPNIVPVICILMYMSLGVIGLLSIPWIMTAELYAIEIRGMAQGVTMSMAYLLMFAAIKVYPFMSDWMGGTHAVQWFFAGVSLFSFVFIFLFMPETHRKELHDIQEYFKNNTVYIIAKKKKKDSLTSEEVQNKNEVVQIVVDEYKDDK